MEVHTFNKDAASHKCSNCAVGFQSEEDYRQHYRSEFHRYNVKRRMVGLASATFEQFNSKKASEAVVVEQPSDFTCKKCKYQ
jgi:pre-60S factor REI1